MTNTKIHANDLNLGQIGWKSYNSIKKKAMEQEFSWSGLIINLSIAFFIVLACAQTLHIIHQTLEKRYYKQGPSQLYKLEYIKSNTIYIHNDLNQEYIDSDGVRYLLSYNLV